jgi:hypothetical protein
MNLDQNPTGGERVAAIVDDTINAPAESMAKAKAAIGERSAD